MKVGFYHVPLDGRRSSYATMERMVRSVQIAMPGVDVVWLQRQPAPLALACLMAYASVYGDWLFVDTDIIVREDVRSIFDQDFDIAVAERDGTLKAKEIGTKFMARMPYNKGAVFSRSQAFWQAAVQRCVNMKPSLQDWMGDQQAMNDVIKAGQFKVESLNNRYNYAPLSQNDDVSRKAIIHYKGKRKAWLAAC